MGRPRENVLYGGMFFCITFAMKGDSFQFKTDRLWLIGEVALVDRKKKEYCATIPKGDRSVEARGSNWLLASLICCAKYYGYNLVEPTATSAARREGRQKTKVKPKGGGGAAKKKSRLR